MCRDHQVPAPAHVKYINFLFKSNAVGDGKGENKKNKVFEILTFITFM
jgi:hypothetical protein